MKADATTTTAVLAVLNRMAQAYSARDIGLLRSTIAPDPDVLMYGTNADEKRLGLASIEMQAQRDWSQTDSASVVYESVLVSAAGSVAWAAADASFKLSAGGEEMLLPARITFVLENRGGEWLIVQSHFSLPAAGQEEGESFPS